MRARSSILFLWLVLAAALLAAAPARAATASDWVETEQGAVRLIAAQTAAGDGRLDLALQFRMRPGWKIYWRSPGDAGYPPSIDWSPSENVGAASLEWPAPERFSLFGIDTVGYEHEAILPIDAAVPHAVAPVRLRPSVDWLTCSDICVPQHAELALDLPAGAASPSPEAPVIAAARARVPADQAGLRVDGAAVLLGSAPQLELTLAAATPFAHPDIFVEGPPGLAFGRPLIKGAAANGATRVSLPISGDAQGLPGQRVRLTLVDGPRLAEREVMLTSATPGSGVARLLPMLAIAVLGGLILNLMPCVLPVLSMKLLGAISHAARPRREVRLGFLATAAGIVFSFLLLAGVLVGLKAAGVAVGWGFQFQQPVFLAGMAAIVTLFAANLLGFFELRLPRFAADLGAGDGALAGNFATGALATLLATPCSAPFLGTAVGFALAGGATDILVIFFSLGVGLALPYLAVAAFPVLARLLPRPGRWMLALRRILGVLLAGTAVWLLVVLAAGTGLRLALIVGALLLGAGLLLALLRASPRRAGLVGAAMAAALVVAALPAPAQHGRVVAQEDGWRSFDEPAIATMVREGRTVLVDVTADWCLTCQVNKRLVLDTAAVRDALTRADVVVMRADWTRPDEKIAAYLRSFGRYGIPFNAVYGPAAPGGLPLSELLSTGEVLRAVERAAGSPAPAAGRAAAAAAPARSRGGGT